MATEVHLERRGAVAVLTLDGPDRLNAIGRTTLVSLTHALDEVSEDEGLRAVVVTGAGKAFSAGADLDEIEPLTSPAALAEHLEAFTDTYGRLESLPKPTVAALDGIALGGGLELALACDLRIGSSVARVGLPEVKLGLLPGAGGTQRIVRLLPVSVARALVLTGEPLDATDALRHGLFSEVTEPGAALDAAVAVADQLAVLPPLALAAAKRLLATGPELALDEAIALERSEVAALFDTKDRLEGFSAFRARRPPAFTGR